MYQVVIRLETDSEGKNIKPHLDKEDRIFYVEEKHIHNFLVAWIRLHHTPGVNPYNNNRTAKLAYVAIHKFKKTKGYWWTSPTLG